MANRGELFCGRAISDSEGASNELFLKTFEFFFHETADAVANDVDVDPGDVESFRGVRDGPSVNRRLLKDLEMLGFHLTTNTRHRRSQQMGFPFLIP